MTRLYIACLGTETNTFVPFPTGRRTFEDRGCSAATPRGHVPNLFSAPLHVWRRAGAEQLGWERARGACSRSPSLSGDHGPARFTRATAT